MNERWVASGRIFTACVWIVGAVSWSTGFTGDVGIGLIFLMVAICMAHIREPIFIQHPSA